MKRMLYLLLYIWELPQNLLGLILLMYFKLKKYDLTFERKGTRLFVKAPIAISLGSYIFWNIDLENKIFILNNVNKQHEYGHSIQSKILGPLYIAIIGITSSLRVAFARYYYKKYKCKWMNYYKGFPENWADKLGEVDSTKGIFI